MIPTFFPEPIPVDTETASYSAIGLLGPVEVRDQATGDNSVGGWVLAADVNGMLVALHIDECMFHGLPLPYGKESGVDR